MKKKILSLLLAMVMVLCMVPVTGVFADVNPAAVRSAAVSEKAALSAPKIKTDVKVTAKTVTVSWNKVSGASGYRVYKKTSGGKWTTLKNIFGTRTLTFTDSNAKGVASYAVTAFKKVDGKYVFSSKSAEVKVRTLSKPKLSVKEKETAEGKTIALTGSKVSGANGYDIYQKIGKDGKWTAISKNRKEPTLKYTVEQSGTYFFAIRAVCKSKTAKSIGAFSNQVKVEYVSASAEPNILITCPNKTEVLPGTNIYFQNKSDKPIRIFSDGAYMIDPAGCTYFLSLVDETGSSPAYIDCQPGFAGDIGFITGGDFMIYDPYSQLFFCFEYDGGIYLCLASYYFGNFYERVK